MLTYDFTLEKAHGFPQAFYGAPGTAPFGALRDRTFAVVSGMQDIAMSEITDTNWRHVFARFEFLRKLETTRYVLTARDIFEHIGLWVEVAPPLHRRAWLDSVAKLLEIADNAEAPPPPIPFPPPPTPEPRLFVVSCVDLLTRQEREVLEGLETAPRPCGMERCTTYIDKRLVSRGLLVAAGPPTPPNHLEITERGLTALRGGTWTVDTDDRKDCRVPGCIFPDEHVGACSILRTAGT